MPRTAPSELECVVLGVVWKFGPCTPHAIRTHFTTARNTRFSASAGAIYPLVARLERRGWLRSRRDRVGRQPRRLCEIAPAGLAQLRGWLAPPLGSEDLAVIHDPLRVRVYFLGALDGGERGRFLSEALRGLRRTAARLAEDLEGYERDGVPFSGAATRGALELVRAQARWLRSVRGELTGRSSAARKGRR